MAVLVTFKLLIKISFILLLTSVIALPKFSFYKPFSISCQTKWNAPLELIYTRRFNLPQICLEKEVNRSFNLNQSFHLKKWLKHCKLELRSIYMQYFSSKCCINVTFGTWKQRISFCAQFFAGLANSTGNSQYLLLFFSFPTGWTESIY